MDAETATDGRRAKRPYEPPHVVRLGAMSAAAGACGPGSSAVDDCTANGASATTDCLGMGGSASATCTSSGASAFACELGDATA